MPHRNESVPTIASVVARHLRDAEVLTNAT